MTGRVRGGFGNRPAPVLVGEPCTAEVIQLDDRPTIRVTQGNRLIGYFDNPVDVDRHLGRAMRELHIVERVDE